MAVRFQILGPVRVVGEPAQGPRDTKVLAALLLRADETVPVEDLIDHVWDDGPPATARRQIQNCIWMLRRRLDIVADGPGYRIATHGRLDAAQFAAGVAAAAVEASAGGCMEAVERLRTALALWRGPALAGCVGRLFRLRADRLNEQRLAAIEQRIDLELQLGRHAAVVAELTELVGSRPLRERLVAQLMRALSASGRRADALATYRRARARLADELGIDLGVELDLLHTSILRDASPGPVPRDPMRAAIDCAVATGLDRRAWQLAWGLANDF